MAWNRAGVLEAKIAAIKAVITRHEMSRGQLNPAVVADAWEIEHINMMLRVAKMNLKKAEKELKGLKNDITD